MLLLLVDIQMRPAERFAGACAVEQECFSPSPVFSPTRSFLQLTDVSITNPGVRTPLTSSPHTPLL